MSRVVVHIGANKTGSTSLQRLLFARHAGLCYRGEDGVGFDRYGPTLQAMVEEDDLYVDQPAIARVFDELRADAAGRTAVYSNEDIARSPVPTVCADRLARHLPEATIVLVVRDQRTAIPSWYVNHGAYLKNVPRRYWRRFVGFDEWMNHHLAFPRWSPLRGFDYAAIAGLYADRFPRVEVLVYEELLSAPDRYADQWAALLDVPSADVLAALTAPRERTRYTRRTHTWHRVVDPVPSRLRALAPRAVADRWTGLLDRGPPMRDWLSADWKARIGDMFAASNARLAARFDLPLADFGYALTPGAQT